MSSGAMSRGVIGIDPGISGAIAYVDGDRASAVCVPVIDGGISEHHLAGMIEGLRDCGAGLAVIEKVGAMPKQGVVSMFKFGTSYGIVRGICAGLKIPTLLVTPQQWKKTVLVGLDWKGHKEASIAYVQRRFPLLSLLETPRCRKPHDGMADAVCLALYGAALDAIHERSKP